MLDLHMKPCPACKYPIDADAQCCPRCRWSRREAAAFLWEFWGGMAIFAMILASALIVGLLVAAVIERSLA